MPKPKTAKRTSALITFLLDRTGSMGVCKAATIEGFNAYLRGLKDDKVTDIFFTLLQFDTGSIDKLYVAEPVAKVEERTDANYQPRGGTPLIDAAVKTINAVEASLAKRDDKPKVVVCIQTDGDENASSEHTWEELAALIKTKQEAGWEFNFMGAGIDAYQQATKMGISANNTMSYDHRDLARTKAAFGASAAAAQRFSAGASESTAYLQAERAQVGDRFAPAGIAQPPVPRRPVADIDLSTQALSGQSARISRGAIPDFDL